MGTILAHQAGEGFLATTWMDENRALFRALRLERLVTALFIGLITFVAGLNILVVLAMTVSDRAHDVAVLMAMGARREQIARIFVLLGLTVGGLGTAVGLAGGYASGRGRREPTNSYRWTRRSIRFRSCRFIRMRPTHCGFPPRRS